MEFRRNLDGQANCHKCINIMYKQAINAVYKGKAPVQVVRADCINFRMDYHWISSSYLRGQDDLLAEPNI